MADLASVSEGHRGLRAEEELARLLAEKVQACIERERSAYDQAAGTSRSVVLFGAGRLGRRTAHALQGLGRPPDAFSDNERSLWGSTIDGIPVLSPPEAAARYGQEAVFVVTIWRAGGSHRFAHSREQLEGLGCRRVVPISLLAWRHAEEMLPHYCLDLPHKVLSEADRVRAAFALLSDDRSRNEFASQLRFRLAADFDGLAHPNPEPQYLAAELFTPRDDEVVVDCGAFDGDTLRSWIAEERPFARYVALEPDRANFSALQRYVSTLPGELSGRVEPLPIAAYSERTRMQIVDAGSASAVLAPTTSAGRVDDVECIPLDEVLGSASTSFLKMDIEGAEPDALKGAREIIARDRPIIAMCVYHRQNHLWQLPLLVHSIVDEYRYFLRPYNEEGWDLVCYAVPNERALAKWDAQ